LEFAFFHRVDQQLLQRLRESLEAEEHGQLLAEFTGIHDPEVLRELVALGIRKESIAAFSLFPLVQVAWANGFIDHRECLEALRAAESVGCPPGSLGYRLMEEWLTRRPGAHLAQAWHDYMEALFQSVSAATRRVIGRGILRRARQVACAAGGVFGIRRISCAERRVLAELERTLIGTANPTDRENPADRRTPALAEESPGAVFRVLSCLVAQPIRD
jgi:hypothetical protein